MVVGSLFYIAGLSLMAGSHGFISIMVGGGLLIGWLQFGNDGTNDLAGTVRWIKPNQPTSKLYQAGFNVNSDPSMGGIPVESVEISYSSMTYQYFTKD